MSLQEHSSPISLVIVGCGSRGECYASFAIKYPQKAKVIAIAEPRAFPRNKFLKQYEKTIQNEFVFKDWTDIIKLPNKIADCVVITLPGLFEIEFFLLKESERFFYYQIFFR